MLTAAENAFHPNVKRPLMAKKTSNTKLRTHLSFVKKVIMEKKNAKLHAQGC